VFPHLLRTDEPDSRMWVAGIPHGLARGGVGAGEVANRIPFLVGNRVFVGHWNETMNYPEKGE